jgi:hypothetical protein
VLVQPADELDRLGDERAGVLLRGARSAPALTSARELVRDVPGGVGADVRAIGAGGDALDGPLAPLCERSAVLVTSLEHAAVDQRRAQERDRLRAVGRGVVEVRVADRQLACQQPSGDPERGRLRPANPRRGVRRPGQCP